MKSEQLALIVRIIARYAIGMLVAKGLLPEAIQMDPEFQVFVDVALGGALAFAVEWWTVRVRKEGKLT